MASAKVRTQNAFLNQEESDEDKELQNELALLVDKITGTDPTVIPSALEMMKFLIRTSTTSMTSVPKPLKYLTPYYLTLKDTHSKMEAGPMQKSLADIISLLAMGTAGGKKSKKNRECLKYCLMGTMKNIGDWGHEYVRQLEKEIIVQWGLSCDSSIEILKSLVQDILKFNCTHHAEIQACDLLQEINQLELLPDHITSNTYKRICMYLASCAKFGDDIERPKMMQFACQQYLRFGEFTNALVVAINMDEPDMVNLIFSSCDDRATLMQMAYICARQLYPVDIDQDNFYYDEVVDIMANITLNSFFMAFARELDIMEPKSPEDVYKTWLEPVPPRFSILGEPQMDSARQNLVSSLVNGFVNAGFCSDKLLTVEGGNRWIYRNKEHAMLSATAALGMIHLWDVEGGLAPIDKYLYSTDDFIKAGALLALGIVNCRVKNECDPALALLGDYVGLENETLQIGAIMGMALAYVGTNREDVLDLLTPIIESAKNPEIIGLASVACGMVAVGKWDNDVTTTISNKIIECNGNDSLKSPHMHLAALGLALCYFGARDIIEVQTEIMSVVEEPFKTFVQTMLLTCAFAATGDVLIVQDLLRIVGDKVEAPAKPKTKDKTKDKVTKKDGFTKIKMGKKPEWEYSIGQAIAAIGVSVVSFGEDIGIEMCQRLLGQIGRYGDPYVRKVAPLTIALSSVCNPNLNVMDILTKYSHDSDEDVASNAIFGLGMIGAGTNNARIAATLRQLAVYHMRNPSQLFMVRFAQGLIHMGKGTMTFNPLHTDRMLVDPVAFSGLLVTLVALMEPHLVILGTSHYMLYSLAAAIQPRWLLTFDEYLNALPVTVRVGKAVDVVGKAGSPKTISEIHTHSTPVLLAEAERAELATDQYESPAPVLDGICILKKTPAPPEE